MVPTPQRGTPAPAPAGEGSAHSRSDGHVPGEIGMWFVVLADMSVFASFFGVFLIERARDPALFATARAHLDLTAGMLNTLVLLASSLVVVHGVRAIREGRRELAGQLFTVACGLGLVFLAVKAAEYVAKFGAGITPMSDAFFLYFFVFTGIHALHVVIGLVGLLAMRALARSPRPRPSQVRVVEIGATFWHMVDLLWIVLFPLLYLAS
jgi:nitric oxide reductase NorE protein